MIGKVTFVIGLPGSGKTTWVKDFAEPEALVFDDIVTGQVKDLIQALEKGKHCYVVDPNLCDPTVRNIAVGVLPVGTTTSFVYFENNPEQCKANVKRRNDGRKVLQAIERLSRVYNEHRVDIKVYKP